ncbi:helix-turn-helix domain-containing protein, partial [Bacillus sp. JJ353]|uniref:helix-turn-helix domain-containing protein n=1 Tax=Bacillus sp. JJ353 TaxID=3122967 RepID=UPI0033961CFF
MAGKWFSKEEKLNILSECDQENNSVNEIAEKYVMTKRKNVSLEERIKIAKDCLAHGKDYARSMEIHQVSYQQVYQW